MENVNSLKQFEAFAINKQEMVIQKGGFFREIYRCYAQANCIEIDPCVMQNAGKLDKTLKRCGWWAALQQAGSFMSQYS